MLAWLRRLLCPPPPLPAPLSDEPPPWAADLADLVQKSARLQSKGGLRLEEIERKLEGGLVDVQRAIKEAARGPELPLDDLLDSMDLLSEAAAASPDLREGLGGVLARLERVLAATGLRRAAPLGEAPDGRHFRVVGTEAHADLPEGVVCRVVRAAALHGERLVREGAVITNRRGP